MLPHSWEKAWKEKAILWIYEFHVCSVESCFPEYNDFQATQYQKLATDVDLREWKKFQCG